jgi:AcrR family transcriptional regulator
MTQSPEKELTEKRRPARDAILAAAETLMSQRGLSGVSVREVQFAAGQRNKSAAQYYFGSREGLVDAILESRERSLSERRDEMLRDLDASGAVNDIRNLVCVIVLPLAELSVFKPDTHFARFMVQAYVDELSWRLSTEGGRSQSYTLVADQLRHLLAHLPAQLRETRIDLMNATVVGTLAYWESGRGQLHLPARVRVNDLIDVCVGILTETPSSMTIAELDDIPPRGRRKGTQPDKL